MEELLDVQAKLKAPKNQFNSFGRYNYRSCEDIIEAVKPLLKEHGLTMTISDSLESVCNRVYIKATVTLRGNEGGIIEVSALARESENKKGMDDSQITGTASSYARKYALNGLFLIDDTKDADVMDNATEAPIKAPVKKSFTEEEVQFLNKALKFYTEKEDISRISFISGMLAGENLGYYSRVESAYMVDSVKKTFEEPVEKPLEEEHEQSGNLELY